MQFSKSISAKEGNQLGLIDAVVTPKELLLVSRKWALDIAMHRKPWLSSLRRTDKIGSLSEAREIIKAARQQAKKIAPNMPQHQACLDVIQEGIVSGGYAGILKVCMRTIPNKMSFVYIFRILWKSDNHNTAIKRYLCIIMKYADASQNLTTYFVRLLTVLGIVVPPRIFHLVWMPAMYIFSSHCNKGMFAISGG